MLDIKFIRENPDRVKKACRDKNDKADIDKILTLDTDRRRLLTEAEALRAEQNRASEEIAKAKKAGGDTKAAILAMKEVSQQVSRMTSQIRDIEEELNQALLRVPNIPHDSVPVGPDEEHNVSIREWAKNPNSVLLRHRTGNWARSWGFWNWPAEQKSPDQVFMSCGGWGPGCNGL